MRWVAIAGALAVLGALAFAWSQRRARTDAGAAAHRQRDNSEEVAALRGEVAALRAELNRQRAQTWVRTITAAADAGSAPAPPSSPEERMAADRARAEATYAAVAARFRAEKRDPAWSEPAAARIAEELRQAGLDGALRAVECASTMCQVALELDDEDARERLAGRLVELPTFRTQVLHQHHPDTRPPRVTLYVARPGHQLPLGR